MSQPHSDRSGQPLRGQSLVEVALVFPVIMFVMFVFAQLLVLGHNAVKAQSYAAQYARLQAIGDPRYQPLLRGLMLRQGLIGKASPLLPVVIAEPIPAWRPMRSLTPVTRQPGRNVTGRARGCQLSKRLFEWRIPLVELDYSAEFPSEPVLPGER